MKKQLISIYIVLVAMTSFQSVAARQISGELKKWHKVTLTFAGPKTSETADPNPFLYYRLNAKFSHEKTGKSYVAQLSREREQMARALRPLGNGDVEIRSFV